jgi:hypothetical protein
VECHPVWQQAKLRDLCSSKGIHLSVRVHYLLIMPVRRKKTLSLLKFVASRPIRHWARRRCSRPATCCSTRW